MNIKYITVNDGLNDGIVNHVCQDKFGYIWIATQGALNKFDGRSFKRFSHIQGDSTSAPNSSPVTMACDSAGKLWVGYSTGLVQIDTRTNTFKRIPFFKDFFVYCVIPISKNKLIVGTTVDMYCYNSLTNTTEPFTNPNDSSSSQIIADSYIYDYVFFKNKLLMSSDNAVLIYDIDTKSIAIKEVAEMGGEINRIFIDTKENIWLSCFESKKLLTMDINGKNKKDWSLLLSNQQLNAVATDFITDKQQNTWILGSKNVMLRINKDATTQYYKYENQIPSKMLASIFKTMYLSSDGTIWFASITGVDHFHPEKNIFDVFLPYEEVSNSKYACVAFEDSKGMMWCASPNGLVVKEPTKNSYKYFSAIAASNYNLSSSGIRSLAEDTNGNIWIATAKGIDKYNNKTDKIEHIGIKDSLPPAFYFSICKDSENNIWFGSKDYDGLYYYSATEKKIKSIATHPQLKKYKGFGVRCIFEDSKKRLWVGFDRKGLMMYDKVKQTTTYWINNDNRNEKTISGNFVLAIQEDKTGMVWASSLNAVTGINPDKNEIKIFNTQNGLLSNYCSALAVDSLNRLWIGTSNSLAMLDNDRRHLTYFNENDGMISSSFNEHPGYVSQNGTFYFPTNQGFVKFNPLQFKGDSPFLPCYLSSYTIFNKEHLLPPALDSIKTVELKPEENFFSFDMVAINFNNPSKTWFAYKLIGFDKEWNYSQNPKATYTNVPSGSYTFIYKAGLNRDHWNATDKRIYVHIQQVFYRSLWFRLLLSCILLFILFYIYRFRTKQIREVAQLNERAQLLEKEKSVVMYENLKQQLNPHFLFNSLTSLSSLITTEPKIARQFVDQMSKIYRYILKSSENEIVPLINEINFAIVYIKLQKTRFLEGFVVNINVNEDFNHHKIVPVTIQNMIENALKHNIIDPESPLIIDIFVDEDYLIVKNNLQRKSIVETSNKQGLDQLKSLYKYLSDKPIMIEQTQTYFTIKIPLI